MLASCIYTHKDRKKGREREKQGERERERESAKGCGERGDIEGGKQSKENIEKNDKNKTRERERELERERVTETGVEQKRLRMHVCVRQLPIEITNNH